MQASRVVVIRAQSGPLHEQKKFTRWQSSPSQKYLAPEQPSKNETFIGRHSGTPAPGRRSQAPALSPPSVPEPNPKSGIPSLSSSGSQSSMIGLSLSSAASKFRPDPSFSGASSK